MAVTVKGIRLENFAITRDDSTGNHELNSAEYSLISSADKVLAKQTIGGYNGMKLQPSAKTTKLLSDFVDSYKADVDAALGFYEGAT